MIVKNNKKPYRTFFNFVSLGSVILIAAFAGKELSIIINNYLITNGMNSPLRFIADKSSQIEGVEYLIIVAMFLIFPYCYNKLVIKNKNYI